MKKMRILVFAVLCSALCTAALEAQPATVTIISGNGQLTCFCASAAFAQFDPLVVQVTDASGNPMVGTPVSWNVTAGNAYFGQGGFGVNSITTNTDNTGKATAQIGQAAAQQSGPQFGAQSTITATAGNAPAATFYESQAAPALGQNLNTIDVYPSYQNAPLYATIYGVAGSASPASDFSMSVYTLIGTGIPNVALFIVNADNSVGPSATVPSAYCQTQAGAGNYTALTNQAGVANCNVAFGPVAGNGTYKIVTGGAPSTTAGSPPDSNFTSGALNLSVSAPQVGGVKVISGNNQPTALAGATLQALVAEVVDTSGNALVGQGVTWAATPANSIQLNNEVFTSDSSGLVKVQNPVLSVLAAGSIVVTATSNSNPGAVATFTLTAQQPVTASGLTIISGNNQSAVVGAPFTNQLVVLVTGTNGQPFAGVPVSFSVNGPVSLSVSSTTTNSNGEAIVAATAGITTGPATVTASIGTFSQVFNLTVLAKGPGTISFVNGADGQTGSISPCGIAAIVGPGVAPGGAGLPPVIGPLPYEVATDMVSFGSGSSALSAPIFSVSDVTGQQQILILVPCEVTPGTVPVTVTANGGSETVSVKVLPASPGIFQTTQSDGVVRAVIERPDGSFAGPSNPARRGETVTAFVTGLGPVSPQIASNSLPIWNTPSFVNGQVIVGVNNEGAPVTQAQLSPDLIGVYYIEFEIPMDAPQNNNVVFSVGLIPVGATQPYYSAVGGSKIPVQ